jgi:isoquinoline 1-oxidoreductase beta subunit
MTEQLLAPSSTAPALTRRRMLLTSSALLVAVHIPPLSGEAQAATAKPFSPNAYVRVDSDGIVTIVVALVEMGQGTLTAIPMLIAEELEVDLSKVRIEQAPADEKRYGHPLYGLQITGGSASIQAAWKGLRQAGATAKAMLVSAASLTWRVSVAECSAENGTVKHMPTGRTLSYGALASRASRLPVPKDVPLKDPSAFRLVGTNAPRLDTPSKVNGKAVFGIDVELPNMKIAAIANCPFFGGTFRSMESGKAKAVSGVRAILVTDTAVAVVADHYGAAKKALALLDIRWDEGPNKNFSSKVWGEQLAEAIKGKGLEAVNEGNVAQALSTAARRMDATFEAPPLAHAALEPLNCTIHVRRNACDVWVGTQAPARAQSMVAKVLGLPPEKVVIHNHLIGGGFGRKLDTDYVETAAKLAKQVRYPLKVVFSREEDMQHDAYRPYFRDELSAALDGQGRMVGFQHRIAGSAVVARYAPVWLNKGLDTDAVHTAETPYQIPHKRVEFVRHEPPAGLMTGNWRGVGPTHHAFVNECFVDELAAMAKIDPVAYREHMLASNPRALAVLKLAAQKANWGAAPGPRKGRGLALVDAWGSYAALISDITIGSDGTVKVDRMVCALDCGLAINPDGVEAQMQGGLVFGLTAALYGTLTIEGGRVQQSNFHDYQPLRLAETPQIEIHRIPSTEAPGGVGEIGTAVVAPSIVNAIGAASGKRFRTYPVPSDQLKTA